MSYLRKDEVMGTLQEDRETTLACYNDGATREIIRFCYESMERELERLHQYVPENVVEQPKIYDVDKVIDQLEEEKEYANADFEEYAKEVEPCLDAEYDDTFSQGIERAVKILKQEKEECKRIRHKWIPITEMLPQDESYILVSFDNATMPDIARYEENDEGGTFYPGDDEKSYSSYGIFVNAWMELPELYKGEEYASTKSKSQ